MATSPPIHEDIEDLEEVARLAQRRMLDVMLGVVLSMARGGRVAGCWGQDWSK